MGVVLLLFAAGLGGVGVNVRALRQVQPLGGDVDIRLRAAADGLHLALQHQTHRQRHAAAHQQRRENHLAQRFAYRMALRCLLHHVGAGGQIGMEAAVPVVIAQIVQEAVLQLLLGIAADHALGVAVADIQAVAAVVHAQEQQHAVAVLADAEVVVVVDGAGGLVDAVGILLVVVDGDHVHRAVVLPGDLVGQRFQLLALAVGEQALRVVDQGVAGLGLRPCGDGQRQCCQQSQQERRNSLFHCAASLIPAS